MSKTFNDSSPTVPSNEDGEFQLFRIRDKNNSNQPPKVTCSLCQKEIIDGEEYFHYYHNNEIPIKEKSTDKASHVKCEFLAIEMHDFIKEVNPPKKKDSVTSKEFRKAINEFCKKYTTLPESLPIKVKINKLSDIFDTYDIEDIINFNVDNLGKSYEQTMALLCLVTPEDIENTPISKTTGADELFGSIENIPIKANEENIESIEELDTIQTTDKLNKVYVVNDDKSITHRHRYLIKYEASSGEEDILLDIKFQKGPRYEEGSTSGVIDSDLLEIVRDRLKRFQETEFKCHENEKALHYVENALLWLNQRVEDRKKRSVLGKNKK